MTKKKGKKVKDQGSSKNHAKKKNLKSMNKKKKNLEKNADPVPSDGPLSVIKLVPDVTPTTAVGSSVVAHDNEGTAIRNKENKCGEQTPGFIFMCNGKTKFECYRFRVFGLPRGQLELVKEIKPGSKLFLYDFDLKLLYGVYKATSKGELGLEPTAFNGRFPAQVEFEIFKECLPLPEKIFKEAIRDNYKGSKFRQDLSGQQVKNLIALFRPLFAPACPFTAPASATAGHTLTNVVTPHTLPCAVREERSQLQARAPPPYGSYVPGIHPIHALPIPIYQQVITCLPHDQYKSEEYVGHVQPLKPQRKVQQASYHHPNKPYYLPEAHEPYMHENPSLFVQDPYERYGHTLEVVGRDQVPGYGNKYHALQSINNREIVQHSQNVENYCSQYLPPSPASSHALLQTSAQRELLLSYQTHYPVTCNEDLHQAYADSHQRPLCASSGFQRHVNGNTSLVQPSLQSPLTRQTSLIDANLQRPLSGSSNFINSSFQITVSRSTSLAQTNLQRPLTGSSSSVDVDLLVSSSYSHGGAMPIIL